MIKMKLKKMMNIKIIINFIWLCEIYRLMIIISFFVFILYKIIMNYHIYLTTKTNIIDNLLSFLIYKLSILIFLSFIKIN
jgi:hypothetical protein